MRKFLEDRYVEAFFLAALCSTVFTMSLCHWLLEMTYKYNHNQDSIVDINWVFASGAIISLYYLLRKTKIYFDFTLAMLLTYTLLQGVINYNRENYIMVCYAYFIPIAYIVGKLVVTYDMKDCSMVGFVKRRFSVEKRIILLFSALVVGMFLVSLMDYWPNWKSGWAYGTEAWSSIWVENTTARTTFGLGFVPVVSILFCVIFIYKKHFLVSIAIIVCNILSLYVSIKTEGRECMLMLPLGGIIFGALYLYDNKNIINPKVKIAIKVIPVFCIAVGGLIFATNLFGIRDIYTNSWLADGGGILKNQRIQLDLEGLKNVFAYPTDDIHERYGLYEGHNMTIVVGAKYDVTIMGMLILIKISYTVSAFRMALNKQYGLIKYLLLPTFINLNLYYVLEPNAARTPEYWMAGLLISGMISGYLTLHDFGDVEHCVRSNMM